MKFSSILTSSLNFDNNRLWINFTATADQSTPDKRGDYSKSFIFLKVIVYSLIMIIGVTRFAVGNKHVMVSLRHIYTRHVLWSSQAKLSNRIGGIDGQVVGAYIRLLPVCSDLYFVVFAFIALLWSLFCYRPF